VISTANALQPLLDELKAMGDSKETAAAGNG
jgi:hypothetical protein